MTAATSTSPFAADLLAGPRREGTAMSAAYARFGDDVIAITQPGRLRMPNGIETALTLITGEPVVIGGGDFRTAVAAISCGPVWDPRPHPRFTLSVSPFPDLDLETLAGRGPGLTPLGDDILVGYIAGTTLAGKDPGALAESAAPRTTALSATLLRLAVRGHLPEAAHCLLEDGDLEPLLNFGSTSGKGIALGLSILSDAAGWPGRVVPLTFPRQRFELEITERHPCL
jgi:Protein of unknown function (DUF2877)